MFWWKTLRDANSLSCKAFGDSMIEQKLKQMVNFKIPWISPLEDKLKW